MKQTEIIAQLRSLRESQADFARTNGDEIFRCDVKALDAAIEALERIRWRKVSDELPEMERDRFSVDVLKLVVTDGGYHYISKAGYYPNSQNSWCKVPRMHITYWAYLPEPPEGENDG